MLAVTGTCVTGTCTGPLDASPASRMQACRTVRESGCAAAAPSGSLSLSLSRPPSPPPLSLPLSLPLLPPSLHSLPPSLSLSRTHIPSLHASVCVRACACVSAFVRACVRARACVRQADRHPKMSSTPIRRPPPSPASVPRRLPPAAGSESSSAAAAPGGRRVVLMRRTSHAKSRANTAYAYIFNVILLVRIATGRTNTPVRPSAPRAQRGYRSRRPAGGGDRAAAGCGGGRAGYAPPPWLRAGTERHSPALPRPVCYRAPRRAVTRSVTRS